MFKIQAYIFVFSLAKVVKASAQKQSRKSNQYKTMVLVSLLPHKELLCDK